MAAEYTWKQSNAEVDEPLLIDNSVSVTFTIENTGDATGTELGFYLRTATSDGPFEYPSTDSPSVNLVDILKQGNDGYGLTITQGAVITRFENTTGDSYATRIPLSIGTGTDLDEIAAGASIEVVIDLTFDPAETSKTFYVDLVIQ